MSTRLDLRRHDKAQLTVTLREASKDVESAGEDCLAGSFLLLLRLDALPVRQELIEQVVDNVGCWNHVVSKEADEK
jgi:hypothetical protein